MKNNELFIKFAHQLANSIQDEINNNFRRLDNWEIKPTKNNKRPQIVTKSDINSEKIMRKLNILLIIFWIKYVIDIGLRSIFIIILNLFV